MNDNINIPDSNITTNLTFRQLVLMNMQQLTNFPYIENDFDALTDYELLCLVVKFLNDVIANQNEQNDSITRMYNSFLALQDYVNNTKDELEDAFNDLNDYVRDYFANLDVQDEINNKLDDMVEQGTLQEIIADYLNSKAIFGFDTVADMKEATNLINGSYAKTLGYYSKNDGGSALYKIRKITNDDVIDESFILEMNDSSNELVAELIIEDEINSIQIGCKINDNTFDNGVKFNTLLNYANEKGINVLILQGDYYVSTPIIINEKLYAIDIKGVAPKSNLNGVQLIYTGTGYCLTLAKGGLKYKLSDFAVTCNGNNSGINCEGVSNTTINFKNYISNITISGAIIGMRVVSTTYTMIDNYTFGGHENTQVGLQIEGYEFTYINNSSIDGYSRTDENSIALKITGGLNYYINNLDLCNFGQGKAIYMTDSTYQLYTLYFDNINIIRCDGGVVTESSTTNIASISFDNTLIALSGTNENSHYFYSIPNGRSISGITINNLTIRNLAQTTIPDYIYEQSAGGIFGLNLQIKDLYNCPVYKSGIKGGDSDKYYYQNDVIRMEGMKYITTNGTSFNYTFDIEYPKMSNRPFIMMYVVNHNDYKLLNPVYDDTNHKLQTQINFDSAPAQGNIRVGYMISKYGHNQ